MKGKTRMEKGITLIALIITIVVLLILAAVAISSITNDGILSYAQNAAKDYNQAVKNEQEMLEGYLGFLSSEDPATTFEEATKTAMLQKTVNSTVYDAYGNKIVVPAGFKIRVDNTTNNADTVTEGIVIEDENGNQFVWIPVGKIYTDTAKTEANAKNIALGRYVFADGTNDLDGDGTVLAAGEIVTALSKTNPSEELKGTITSPYNNIEGFKDSTTINAHARDIEAFITSANTKGGYYLGRYEARKNSEGDLTTISTDTVWNRVNQATASSESQGMYADRYFSGTFSSDLINSYAWDTAIVFLQTFDNRIDKTIPYSQEPSLSSEFSSTGTITDVICNIYDMASNCFEWSTETSSYTDYPCVKRGGGCDNVDTYTSSRNGGSIDNTYGDSSFRPLLYVAL